MLRLALALLVMISLPGLVSAQSFTVASSAPAHGAAGVPVEASLRLSFELPDDGRAWSVYEVIDFNTVLRVEPREAATYRLPQLLLNDDGRPGVITVAVTHEPDTDYTWLVYDVLAARPGGGGFVTIPMSEPFVLRYTTAPTLGQRTVAGAVVAAPVTTHRLPAAGRAMLRNALAQVQRPVPQAAKQPRLAATEVAESDVTHVYLLSSFSAAPATRAVEAATVLRGPTGAYQVDFVRPGTYWPLVVQYADRYQTRPILLGFYDANGDGVPDPLTVNEGEDVTDVILTVYPYAPASSAEYLDAAQQAAVSLEPAAELYAVRAGDQAQADGTAYTWTYLFTTPDRRRGVVVTGSPLTFEAEPFTGLAPGELPNDANEGVRAFVGFEPLGRPEITATQAASRVLEVGGQAFLDAYLPSTVRIQVEAFHRSGEDAPSFGEPAWLVRYTGVNGDGFGAFERYVNAQAGTVVTSRSPRPQAPDPGLSGAYPHPFAERVTIVFAMPGGPPTESLRAVVYDVLGRQLRVLEAPLRRGTHVEVNWDGRDGAGRRVPPGTYAVRVGSAQATHTQLVVRH
ncbi:MAG: FlgD immunoglobulin-like domain containing protein [Bacteroidota bacterium]